MEGIRIHYFVENLHTQGACSGIGNNRISFCYSWGNQPLPSFVQINDCISLGSGSQISMSFVNQIKRRKLTNSKLIEIMGSTGQTIFISSSFLLEEDNFNYYSCFCFVRNNLFCVQNYPEAKFVQCTKTLQHLML